MRRFVSKGIPVAISTDVAGDYSQTLDASRVRPFGFKVVH